MLTFVFGWAIGIVSGFLVGTVGAGMSIARKEIKKDEIKEQIEEMMGDKK